MDSFSNCLSGSGSRCSAPVIRESGGDRSAVTGGTHVLSDRIVIRITSEKGNTFLDRMISMVEGAQRQKTPNEIALIPLALKGVVCRPKGAAAVLRRNILVYGLGIKAIDVILNTVERVFQPVSIVSK